MYTQVISACNNYQGTSCARFLPNRGKENPRLKKWNYFYRNFSGTDNSQNTVTKCIPQSPTENKLSYFNGAHTKRKVVQLRNEAKRAKCIRGNQCRENGPSEQIAPVIEI